MKNDNALRKLIAHAKELTDIRLKWIPKFREQRDYILPSHGYALDDEDATNLQDADDRGTLILDNTAENAVNVLAAGLQSGMTSPASIWFKLQLADPGLMGYEPVKEWLSYVEKMMRDVLAKSNVYKSLHHTYLELATFSTGAMAALEDYKNVVRFRPFTAGEYALAVNAEGQVDTFYREMRMTARQIVQKYGEKNVSEHVRSAYKGNRSETEFVVCHMIEPSDMELGLETPMGKANRSVYWEKNARDGEILRVSGFNSFPVMAPRWTVVGQQIYGRGPGEGNLADIKMLQKMKEKYLIAVDKSIEPPMAAPGSMKGDQINTMPGGVTYNDEVDNKGLRPLYEMRLDLNAVQVAIQSTQGAIKEGFYNDLFKMLASLGDRQRTAREIAERHEEKLLMLGPVLERLHGELLDPLIDRTYEFLETAGLIPPPPPEMENIPVKPEYTSMLAQAQKMVGSYAVQETLNIAGQLATVAGPSAFDVIDIDRTIRHVADIKGVDPTLLRSPEEIAALRESRAKAQQAQAQTENMAQAAGAIKDLGNTPADPNSALGVALGALRNPSA